MGKTIYRPIQFKTIITTHNSVTVVVVVVVVVVNLKPTPGQYPWIECQWSTEVNAKHPTN